ncbi:MAG: hypothetical protein HFJ52_01730 [Clostridia bacterium]|nr:hypothetical protein [Clostridia bacterium]
MTVNWLSTGNLIIRKVDEKNQTVPIEGTVFDVYTVLNKLVDTITTDSKGIARLNNIKLRSIQNN